MSEQVKIILEQVNQVLFDISKYIMFMLLIFLLFGTLIDDVIRLVVGKNIDMLLGPLKMIKDNLLMLVPLTIGGIIFMLFVFANTFILKK
tara:strand:- start:1801 stop:2070 length:270 start_codon:yes stop_codon:yes gene_type:complete